MATNVKKRTKKLRKSKALPSVKTLKGSGLAASLGLMHCGVAQPTGLCLKI